MRKLSDKQCNQIFGKYLFAGDPSEGLGLEKFPRGISYKREENTEIETEIFFTVNLDWYTKWKRTSKVIEAFEVLCGCKESKDFKRILDPGNRQIYRGLHLSKNSKTFMKTILDLPKPHRREIFGTRWLGANYTYTPLHRIESWSDSVHSAFLFAAPGGALNTQRAKFLQLQYMAEMEKGYEMLLDRKLDQKQCSDLILTKGLSVLFESSTDDNSVMKPEFSNNMFSMMTGMKPENEVVRLSRTPMKSGIVWFPEDVVKIYNKSSKLEGKPKKFAIFTKKDDLLKPAKWIRPREVDFQQEWRIEWNLHMKPLYGDIFPKYTDFKKHVSQHGKVISINFQNDGQIEKRSRKMYFEDLINLLKTYKSWGTPYRNERTVAALDQRIRSGEPMAMPIILNFVGREWKNPWAKSTGSHKVILGGNTRCDIAFWYNPSIKIFELTLNSRDFISKQK
jgi:hypothetical protein